MAARRGTAQPSTPITIGEVANKPKRSIASANPTIANIEVGLKNPFYGGLLALGFAVSSKGLPYSEALDTLLRTAAANGLWDYETDDFEAWVAGALSDAAWACEAGDLEPDPPHVTPPRRIPVEEAREQLQEAISGFFHEASGFRATDDPKAEPPIVHGIRAGVGLGKSDLARRAIADMLIGLRAAGDRRPAVVAVPTHKLGEEWAKAFEVLPEARAAGLTASVWRGREADDPSAPGEGMCRDPQAVRDAQAAGVRVEASVCRKPGGAVCALYSACGYQRQKAQTADLWLVPHEALFTTRPTTIGEPAVLVVDEAVWSKGLRGVEGKPDDLTFDTLTAEVTIANDPSGLAAAELREAHRVARAMLDDLQDGPLERATVAKRMMRETARAGCILSWRRLVDPGLRPSMTAAERKALVRAAAGNREAMRCARFFGAVEALLADDGPVASGWASLVTVETDDGPVRVVRLRGRRDVAKGWRVPTLHLDATLNVDLLRPYWPQIQMTAEIEADAPHQRIVQMSGRDWGKTALVPNDRCGEAEEKRREKNSARVRAAVLREARAAGGRVLVVTLKDVEDQWRQAGRIPSGIDLAHFNAIAGRDEWGPGPSRDGVALLIVVGRTSPRPRDVERLAEALSGRAVTERVEGFGYPREPVPLEMRDGTTATGESDRHPDPVAEAVRWSICEGELVQAIGRGRGVNRGAGNCLDVLIMTDRPLPVPVDQRVPWDALAPDPVDHMLSAGGVALSEPVDMAAAYPSLWPSHGAAKNAVYRATSVTNLFRVGPKEVCDRGRLTRATYQRTGKGRRMATAIFDPQAVPDLRAWLEERVGPLARLEIEPRLIPEQPAPRPAAPRPELVRPIPAPAPGRAMIISLFGLVAAEPPTPDLDDWGKLPEPVSDGPGLFEPGGGWAIGEADRPSRPPRAMPPLRTSRAGRNPVHLGQRL